MAPGMFPPPPFSWPASSQPCSDIAPKSPEAKDTDIVRTAGARAPVERILFWVPESLGANHDIPGYTIQIL